MTPKNRLARLRYDTLLKLLSTGEGVWNASRRFFLRWDLSPSQFNTLNLLHEAPAGLTQIELSRALITHRSNITGLVDRLEKRGLVKRHPVPGDRRAHQVELTAAGERLLEEILPEYYQRANDALDGLNRDDLRGLDRALDQIINNTDRVVAGLED